MEGRLLRMAVDSKVKREDFLHHYYGHELDPNWIDRLKGAVRQGLAAFSGAAHQRCHAAA